MKWLIGGFGLFLMTIGVITLNLFPRPNLVSSPLVEKLPLRSPSTSPFLPQPLTLTTFFDNKVAISPDHPGVTTLLVTGDVLTARSVNRLTLEKNDFTWAWQKTADELQAADITYINLETPLVTDCPIREGDFIFCGDLRHVMGLRYAGVDVVNLANNHMGNYGIDGVEETIRTLSNAGMTLSGVDNQAVVTHNDTRFAFLGFNEVDNQVGIALAKDEKIRREVAAARQKAEVVIVQFHWGAEYQYQPTTNQKRLAHLAIDAGADLVVSNHPHWWQPPEIYREKVIVYSHGNFIFDQMWSRETREGIVGKYHFYQGKLVDIEFLPVLIEDYGQPQWLEGAEKDKILSSMQEQAEILARDQRNN